MALELKDLNEDERIALVALLQLIAEADSYVTDPEAKRLRAVQRAMGEKAYQAASDAADGRFSETEDLKTFLRAIDRQEARELIYETVLELVLADARVEPEKEVLDWLTRNWHIKVQVAEPDEK